MGNPDEWEWVDLYVEHLKIKKWDATALPVEDNSVKKIYASHLLEHISHTIAPTVIRHWYNKLEGGGEVIINVPDLVWAARALISYTQGKSLSPYYNQFVGEHGLLNIFYGSQSHEGEYHKSGYTEDYLYMLLHNLGFREINIESTFDAHDMGVLIARGYK